MIKHPYFTWFLGRVNTGYWTMLLFQMFKPWGLDIYLIKYPPGSFIPPHKDPCDGHRHYRLNIILKPAITGGVFKCDSVIFQWGRIVLFRPDVVTHEVSMITSGLRWVLSIGWVIRND